jgi:uncharacterized protein (TIGR03067 family)
MQAHIRWISGLAVLLFAGAALADEAADRAKANKDGLEKLQGQWKVTSLLVRGKEVDEFVKLGIKFKFKDDTLTVSGDQEGFTEQARVFKFDASTNPKMMDFAETAKAFEEKKDVVEGVYTLDGDTLSICFKLDGMSPAKASRPANVESKEDSSTALIKLDRAKS